MLSVCGRVIEGDTGSSYTEEKAALTLWEALKKLY